MARFERIHTPVFVSAFRPGLDRTPPWAKKVGVRLMKSVPPSGWLVKEHNRKDGLVAYSKADFAKHYRHDA